MWFRIRIRTFRWISSAFDVLHFYGWWISETDCFQHEWHQQIYVHLQRWAEMGGEDLERCSFGSPCRWHPGWVLEERHAPCRGDERANWLWLSLRILCQTFQADGLWTTHMKAAGIYGKWSSVLTCGSRQADTPLTGPLDLLPTTSRAN